MLADNRLPFAKSAIQDLLYRLNSSDRFALVTFDTSASVVSPLTSVTDSFRLRETALVSSLNTGGSTNLSGGLELARGLLSAPNDGRKKKVILLSDGEANVGIVDPSGLANLARSMSQSNTIVSTIGMGLGFNEVLMSSLADNGMGNYGYLENLSALNEILQRELDSTRAVYASASVLELELPEGCTLQDSSGYPQEQGADSRHIRLLTGQLVGGSKKTFMLTFRAPTEEKQTFSFGKVGLNYTVDGKAQDASLGTPLAVSVIDKAREPEALDSVDAEVFKKSWVLNNFGKVQQEISREIRAGNAPAAKAAIANYESSVRENARRYKMKLEDDGVKQKLDGMNATVDDLMSSNGADKDEKGSRAAKDLQAQGVRNQRQ